MFCNQCGQKIDSDSQFCENCGVSISKNSPLKKEDVDTGTPKSSYGSKNPLTLRRIISGIIILGFLGFGIYASLDEEAVTKNNSALESFESGDSASAVAQLQQASQEASLNENKLNSLKNLGYVHTSEGESQEALSAFNQALALAERNSFDYFLISGEIALLEGDYALGLSNLNKAYEIIPKDFQVNNSLSLLHLDLEEVAPEYEDYPKALAYAQTAYDYDTEKSEVARQNLAVAHFFNENYNQTISLLSQSNLTQHPFMNYWLGLAYVAKGDDFNGKFYLQRAVDAGFELPQEIYDYLSL